MKIVFDGTLASGCSRLILVGAAVAALSLSSHSGNAAVAASPEGGQESAGLEEIVVTAQRKQESAQKVPLTVDAFSENDIKQFSIVEPKDLQFTTPGLTFTQDNSTINPYIRGRGTNFSGTGLEGSVPIYIDDVYLESQFGAESLVDMANLQVLKGPQGTLYGRNATGGVLLFETNNPTHELGGHIEAGGGNYGQIRSEAVVNIPVSSTLSLRFAGGYQRTEGFVTNVVDGEKMGQVERYQFRGKALFEPTDDFSALLKVEYDHSTNSYLRQQIATGAGTPTGLGFYETHQSPNYPTAQNPDPLDTSDVYSTTLRLAYRAEHWSATNVTGVRYTQLHTCSDNDNTFLPLDQFCVNVPAPAHGFPRGISGAYDHTLTDEFRLATSFPEQFNGAAGISYQRSESRFPTVLRGLVFGPFVPISDSFTGLDTYAGFAELYYQLGGFKLTAGGRYTLEKRNLRVNNNADLAAIGIPAVFAPGSFTQEAQFHVFTPRVVLAYDSGAVNYYASYNEGYKSGGFNVPPFVPFSDTLDSEKTKGYEVGAKSKFWDNRARLDVALFQTKTTNLQVAVVNPATNSVIQQNAAGAKAQGAETSLQVKVLDDLTVQAGASWLHSRFTLFPNASVYSLQNGVLNTEKVDLAGAPTTDSPNFTGNISATYDIHLPSAWTASVTALTRFSSSYDFTPGAGGELGADHQKHYSLTDLTARLTAPNGRYTMYFWANNLFQTHYYNVIETTGGFGIYGVQASPRLFGASLRYTF